MAYFVLADDGRRYGPADIETLNRWIAEGRLLPSTLLEEAETETKITAGSIAALNFGAPTEPAATQAQETPSQPSYPGGYGQNYYQRPAESPKLDVGNGELAASWVFGIIGIPFCVCCFFSVIGIVFGFISKSKGNRGAMAAIIFNTTVLVLSLIFVLASFSTLRDSFMQSYEQQMRIQRGLGGGTPPSGGSSMKL